MSILDQVITKAQATIPMERQVQGLHLFQRAKRLVLGDQQPTFSDEKIADVDELDASGVADLVAGALAGIQQRGKADRGEKTMVDAWAQAADAAREAADAGASAAEVWRAAASKLVDRPSRRARVCVLVMAIPSGSGCRGRTRRAGRSS